MPSQVNLSFINRLFHYSSGAYSYTGEDTLCRSHSFCAAHDICNTVKSGTRVINRLFIIPQSLIPIQWMISFVSPTLSARLMISVV